MEKDKLLAKAAKRAEIFFNDAKVKHYLRPFDEGGEIDVLKSGKVDPLFLWSLEKLTGNPEVVIILQDWDLERDDIGTTESCRDWTERYYKGEIITINTTFLFLFGTYWSRSLIEKGKCLILNAVWGLRKKGKFESASTYLPDELHAHARSTLWLELVGELQPKRVYLAKSWADEKACRAAKDKYSKIDWGLVCHPSSRDWFVNEGNIKRLLQS